MMKKTFHILTHGCRVNQYESEAIAEAWKAAGYSEAPATEAEILLLMSCAVTAKATTTAKRSLQSLRAANPKARLIFSGCAAALPEFKKVREPDLIVPAKEKERLLHYPQEAGAVTLVPANKFPPFSLTAPARSRAILKIQDGCSHGCAYCIVPLTRGPSRSREFGAILDEAKALLHSGLRELVISGINLRQFTPGLWKLVNFLEQELSPDALALNDKFRIRLSSLDPAQLDTEALERLAASRLLAPHLHLSLQSGSPETLARMRRGHYQPEKILDFLNSLRNIWPRFALGADILLGFPGESQQEFHETLEFVTALPLSYAHVFPYSRRPGTLAADFPNQVRREEAKERAALVRQLADKKKKAFLLELSESENIQEVIFDAAPAVANAVQGVSQFYADCRLTGFSEPAAMLAKNFSKQIIPCKIFSIQDNILLVQQLAK